jgi:hypothetical protein
MRAEKETKMEKSPRDEKKMMRRREESGETRKGR